MFYVEQMLAIEALKAFDRREAVYLVMNDPEMKRLILTWTVYGSVQSAKPGPALAPLDFNATVAHAWKDCQPLDIDRIAAAADMARGTAKQKLETLLRHGLIYPDGTANENALLVIRADVRAALHTLSSRNKKEATR